MTGPPTDTTPETHSVAEILARVREAADGNRVTVGHLLAAFGESAYGPLLLLPALIVVTPLSGIPLLPTVCGLIIALIALQLVLGRRHVWLPRVLLNRQIGRKSLLGALDRLEAPARWLDRRSRPRLSALVRPPLALAPALLCMLCGLAMPFLELLPLTSSLLGMAVSLMAVGFVMRDGLFTVAGMAFIALAVAFLTKLIF
ncbi:MAG: exopolysaccharide biosynthesis protein [Pseudomonadota bacterium]